MVYEVYGKYVEELEKDSDESLEYLYDDFNSLQKGKPPLSLP
jgi:hypothetical protein